MDYSQEFVDFLAKMESVSKSHALIEAVREGYFLTHPQFEGKLKDLAKKGLATAALASSLTGCMDFGTQPEYTPQPQYPTYSSSSGDNYTSPTYTGYPSIPQNIYQSSSSTYQTPQPIQPISIPSSSSVYQPQTTPPSSNIDPTCSTAKMQLACDDYDQIKKSSGNATTAMNVVSDVDGVNRKLINQCCDPTNTSLYRNWCNHKRTSCADSTRHYYGMNGVGRSTDADIAVAKCNNLCDL